jgi:hypothetical protein
MWTERHSLPLMRLFMHFDHVKLSVDFFLRFSFGRGGGVAGKHNFLFIFVPVTVEALESCKDVS